MNFRPRFDVDQLSLASGHFHWSNNQVDEITVITQTHTEDENRLFFQVLLPSWTWHARIQRAPKCFG